MSVHDMADGVIQVAQVMDQHITVLPVDRSDIVGDRELSHQLLASRHRDHPFMQIASISTLTSLGSLETSTATRAGV